uniref:Uncharacterized protein n=1 Tax=Chaetoceros debilis TaxID=122233 RepID=A0A6S8QV48_9STRA|mmetsp:Transcript_18745/g.28477  ORF Transcript_18745/g.28477 Transcript_18745/m.28477 type:complete len:1007 (+) Transcript_18745:253-3273(+)
MKIHLEYFTLVAILSASTLISTNALIPAASFLIRKAQIAEDASRPSIRKECIRRIHEHQTMPTSGTMRWLGHQALHMKSKSVDPTIESSRSTISADPVRERVKKSNEEKNQIDINSNLEKGEKEKSKKANSKRSMGKKERVRRMFRRAKEMERAGQWRQASEHLEKILELDPRDSYSHLALARLQSRRERSMSGQHRTSLDDEKERIMSINSSSNNSTIDDTKIDITPLTISRTKPFSKARQAFYDGIVNCPNNIHLFQAWALHEQSLGNISFSRSLFQKALRIDKSNPYVCHGYGSLEHECGNFDMALELWQIPLSSRQKGRTTAALVCSIGKLLVAKGEPFEARDLYMTHVLRIESEREKSEVYLASAWLEENHFKKIDRAEELLQLALRVSPGNSRAMVALARLEGRRVDKVVGAKPHKNNSNRKYIGKDIKRKRDDVVKKQLQQACKALTKAGGKASEKSEVKDGRLFNAWAKLEVKEGHYSKARDILQQGIVLFPEDHSLLQAAGKVEERLRNFAAARELYSASLLITPSAPTLLAYAMLETNHPTENSFEYTKIARLFQEALLLDPRHGPVYNAYGNMELKMGNVEEARRIYQNGVYANCRDLASVYHGLGMLELSLGNVETARLVLKKGLREVRIHDSGMDSNRRKRAVFLAHTLGMLELNCNRAAEAKAIFEIGIDQHGNSSQLLLGAALSEVKLGNEDAARKLFERSVSVDRKHAQAWQSWAVIEMRAGNYNVAKTLFECGIKNDPQHGALWQAYATMESRRGHIDVARVLFAAGVTKCPEHVPLYHAWACLEVRGENYEKAKTLISEALTKDKTRGTGWLVAAKIEEKMGNEGLVGLILQRGIECAPHSVKLLSALAEYEVKRGKIDVARGLLQKGLEIDPLYAPLYHSLAELEARVFNIDGLAELNKRANRLFSASALEPAATEASMKLLGDKLRMNSQSKKKLQLPAIVSTLSKIASYDLNIEEIANDMDPDTLIESMAIGYEDKVRIPGSDGY